MNTPANPWLLAGGVLSAVAALLHLGCIFGGPDWYRFFGAGEGMARAAARGSIRPTLITLGIATVLAIWSAYALSGAGVIGRLPLLRLGLVVITAIYLLRAFALPVMLQAMPDRGATFLIWSSVIVFVFGAVHAVGLATGWRTLG